MRDLYSAPYPAPDDEMDMAGRPATDVLEGICFLVRRRNAQEWWLGPEELEEYTEDRDAAYVWDRASVLELPNPNAIERCVLEILPPITSDEITDLEAFDAMYPPPYAPAEQIFREGSISAEYRARAFLIDSHDGNGYWLREGGSMADISGAEYSETGRDGAHLFPWSYVKNLACEDYHIEMLPLPQPKAPESTVASGAASEPPKEAELNPGQKLFHLLKSNPGSAPNGNWKDKDSIVKYMQSQLRAQGETCDQYLRQNQIPRGCNLAVVALILYGDRTAASQTEYSRLVEIVNAVSARINQMAVKPMTETQRKVGLSVMKTKGLA